MPGLGWMELLILAALAIVVVGPKDLPILMRTIGRFVGKARALAREFQESFEEIAREAELEELRKENEKLRAVTSDMMTGLNSAIHPGPSPAAPMAAAIDEAKLREANNAEVLAREAAPGPVEPAMQEPLAAGGAAGEEASNVTPIRGVQG